MERIVLHIERLPEGVYLATAEEIPGLVAQGRTVTQTLEIARDVAKKLIEARSELSRSKRLAIVGDTFASSVPENDVAACLSPSPAHTR